MTIPSTIRAAADASLARFCATHLPVNMRAEVRLEAAWRGDTVTLIERRAPWDGRGGEWTSLPIAQLRHTPDRVWRLYWQRSNGRWHELEESPLEDIGRALRVIGRDPDGVFWG